MVRRTLLSTVMLAMLAAFTQADEAGSAEPADKAPTPPDPMVYAEDVVVLGAENFTETVKPEELMLVEFYAPWCGHCKALAPEYAKAATQLKEDKIKLAKVDCTKETPLCNDHKVQGYPTIKVFRKGESKDYSSGRDADAIVSYMKKQALPAVSRVNVDNFDEFKDKDNVVVIGFFAEESQTEFNLFSDLANKLRDSYVFGATAQPALLEKVNVTAPTVILYKKFDNGQDTFEGKFDEDSLKKFIKANSQPLLGEIGPNNYAEYVDSGIPLAYIFYGDEEQRTAVGKHVEPVAKEFKGKVNFVLIDARKYGAHAETINLKQEWPAFGIQKPEEGYKYPFNQSHEITTEAIREFVTKFDKGDLTPSIKSQPIPEKNDDPVVTVVADSFVDIVYDKDKDVLVEFYAPWCGHCKKLAPTYDQLGEKYAAFKDKVVIAKMDATENDVPPRVPVRVDSFPTIKLFKAGAEEKEIVDYSGDRTLESFIQFIEKNALNKVEVEDTVPKTDDSKVAADNKTEKEKVHDEL